MFDNVTFGVMGRDSGLEIEATPGLLGPLADFCARFPNSPACSLLGGGHDPNDNGNRGGDNNRGDHGDSGGGGGGNNDNDFAS